MNYRESLLTLTDTDGETHILSAFKVKAVKGNADRTRITAEPVDGQPVTFTVAQPITVIRQELMRALAAGE